MIIPSNTEIIFPPPPPLGSPTYTYKQISSSLVNELQPSDYLPLVVNSFFCCWLGWLWYLPFFIANDTEHLYELHILCELFCSLSAECLEPLCIHINYLIALKYFEENPWKYSKRSAGSKAWGQLSIQMLYICQYRRKGGGKQCVHHCQNHPTLSPISRWDCMQLWVLTNVFKFHWILFSIYLEFRKCEMFLKLECKSLIRM